MIAVPFKQLSNVYTHLSQFGNDEEDDECEHEEANAGWVTKALDCERSFRILLIGAKDCASLFQFEVCIVDDGPKVGRRLAIAVVDGVVHAVLRVVVNAS